MNIEIIDKNAEQSLLDKSSIIWKLQSQKDNKTTLIQILFGLILLILGIADFSSDNTITIMDKTTNFNFHFVLSFGIIIIFFALFNLVRFAKSKKIFFLNAKEIAKRQTYGSNEMTIIINEEYIKYNCASLKEEIKWVLFSNYKLFDNFLFLYRADSILSSTVIDKRLISEKNFVELMDFVKKKLIEKNNFV